MNAPESRTAIAVVIGAMIEGGFSAGRFRVGEDLYELIAAPKAEGEHEDAPWNKSLKRVDGALSYCDGRHNTLALAEAGSELARWALELRIGGFDDWYLPSRDELELCYRNLKPAASQNYTWRSGDNPSSVPPGYPYTDAVPGQTDIAAFREGGAETFDTTWYWTSTQYEPVPDYAWIQSFDDGYQGYDHGSNRYRARAVRRIKVI